MYVLKMLNKVGSKFLIKKYVLVFLNDYVGKHLHIIVFQYLERINKLLQMNTCWYALINIYEIILCDNIEIWNFKSHDKFNAPK